jgi:hypothetical protein
MKASEEQPHIPNVYSSDNAGLGKLRYIAGRCVAKCKYHYMEMGRNNMYKPKKQSVVTASFLKVKIMDHFTATYSIGYLQPDKILKLSQSKVLLKMSLPPHH